MVGAGLIQTVTASQVTVALVEKGEDVRERADVGEGVAVRMCNRGRGH